MRLISLKIYKKKNGEIIRDVHFNERGLSLICDLENEENRAHGSSIGKTAFIRCIDICFGAKSSSTLYQSSMGVNEGLKDYLFRNEVSLILTCSRNGENIVLERHLYDNEGFINGLEFQDTDSYCQKLKEIFFPNSPSKATFRQMILLFVRIDCEEPIKYLDNFTKNQQYNRVYSYFLNLFLDEKEASLNEEITSKKAVLCQLEEKYGVKGAKGFSKLVDERNGIRQRKKQIVHNTDYVGLYISKDGENAALVDALDKATEELNAKKYKSKQLSRTIEAENERLFEMDEEVLKELYQDAEENFAGLEKSFKDFCAFHNDMCKLRVNKYVEEKKRVDEEIAKLEMRVQESRKKFSDGFVEYKTSVDDKESSLFEDYYSSKKDYEEAKDDFEQYLEAGKRLSDIKASLLAIKARKETNEDNIRQFSSIFEEKTKKLIGDAYKAVYETKFDKMMFGITGPDGNLGTGDLKVISYALNSSFCGFFTEKSMSMPSFVIQDRMENVEIAKLEKIIQDVRSSGIQYIVPILSDRIENLDIKDEEITLKLSKKDKLFKYQQ